MATLKALEQNAPAAAPVRIANILLRSIMAALFVIVAAGSALALPPAVELDRLMLHGKAALQANAYAEAVDHFSRAKKLGIALPEDFALGYATALSGAGKTKESKAVLDAYFTKYGTKGASYKEVLKLLVQIEDQEQGKTGTGAQPPSAVRTEKNRATGQGRSTKAGALPARPQLPFPVSEDIWRVLEASEAYRTLPTPRGYRISYQATDQAEYTGAKSKSLKRPAATSKSERIEATSLDGAFEVIRSNITVVGKLFATENYVCGGFLSFGSTTDGKTTTFLKSVDELTGSLFPMRVGNQMYVRYRSAYTPDRKFDSSITSSCRVTGQRPASELNPGLKGTAWRIQCSGSYASEHDHKTTVTPEIDDYYLEDLGLRLSAIGRLNYTEKKFILPQPGDQTVLIAEGEYGSRTTTTYTSYDWSIDTESQEKGGSDRPQQASAAGSGAPWGLADEDLSIMLGQDIMTKVGMAERRADILAAAQAGDMVSQYLIGSSYAYGVGVSRDEEQKVYWLTRSAEQGLVRAYAALGMARISGKGMPQDSITGWTWLMLASNAGNATGQYMAAILTLSGLDEGNGIRQFSFLKRADALVLLKRSAEAGMPAAQYALGHSYLVGTKENKKNLKLARVWLEKAAAQNLPEATNDLATMKSD